MEDVLLQDWEKKSADHQRVYKQFLLRANKNKVLKALPSLTAYNAVIAVKGFRHGLKHPILNVLPSI